MPLSLVQYMYYAVVMFHCQCIISNSESIMSSCVDAVWGGSCSAYAGAVGVERSDLIGELVEGYTAVIEQIGKHNKTADLSTLI